MSQWGFYFNQDRCLGCKTCMTACKNWNDERRGDVNINVRDLEKYTVSENEKEPGTNFINTDTGTSNYTEYRKFYMKENWRRLTELENGSVITDDKGVFQYNIDRRYISVACNHCTDPACVKACPQARISKEGTYGAVLVGSPDNCISCGRCKEACPWGAPQFYADNPASFAFSDPNRPRMTKCTMCLDRVKEGLKPACVAACWNRALDAGPMEELATKYPAAVRTLEGFESDFVGATNSNTDPNIRFKKKS